MVQNQLKILYIATEMGTGGAESVTRSLVRSWKAEGHDVDLLLTYTALKNAQLMRDEDGIRVTELDLPHGIKMLLTLGRVWAAVRELKPDVVIINNQTVLLPWVWALKSVATGGVYCAVHSMTTTASRGEQFAHRFFLSRFTKVIALAEPHARYLQSFYKVPFSKIRIVQNGVALNAPTTPKEIPELQLSVPFGAKVGVICARLHPEKNHQMLFEAAQIVIDSNSNFHLVIIGDGTQRAALEATANHLGITKHIHFLGLRRDFEVASILKQAQIGLLSSITETLSIAILEYMRAGLPVITTRVGALEAQVLDGINGFVVPSSDSPAMANAILKVINDDHLQIRMGEKSRALQRTHFTEEGMIHGYLDVFREGLRDSKIP